MASQKKPRPRPQASPFYSTIPMAVKVRRRKYSIQKLPAKVASEAWGDTNLAKKVVRLHDGMNSPRLADTVIHEILHAIIGEASLPTVHDGIQASLIADPLNQDALTLTDRLEEAVVAHLATGLLDVLTKNDDLRAWLFDVIEHIAQARAKKSKAAK